MNIIKGEVIKGLHIGKTIGFPTVNIEVKEEKICDFGVYICEIEINKKKHRAVMHYGPKTIGTPDKNKIFLEVHVFDFDENVYGETVLIKLLKKIREVRKFLSVNALKKQIIKDIEITKKYFNAEKT